MRRVVDSIPTRSWLGALLCRWGFHEWKKTGSRQTVIPTGNALLIKQREDVTICARRDCTARRTKTWKRES